MGNVDQWSRAVEQWTERYFREYLEEVVRRVSLAIFTPTVRTTSVFAPKEGDPPWYPKSAGGRARGGWQISIGSPSAVPYDDRPGEAQATKVALDRAIATLSGYRGFEPVWITNPVVYIRTLEFGGYPNPPKQGTGRTVGGFSTQAPRGMLRLAINTVRPQIPNIARAAAREMLRL